MNKAKQTNGYHFKISTDRKYSRRIPACCIVAFALCQASAAEPIKFIPATPENTTLVDGSPVNTKEGEGDWKWLPAEGNQGIFESYGDPKKNAPGLLVIAKELEPNRDYEVFGFFWAHGFGTAPASRGKQPFHWPARFGTGLATLTTYGGRLSQDIPWIICPESKTGIRFGYTAVLEEKNPLVKDVPNWITSVDDTRLIRARLGISRADRQGTLPVYVDDFPDSKFCGHTRIDGIGLHLLPAGDHDSVGAGKPGHLHLAVRAGDHRNMRRELAAGADVNALDEDGVTPLLYPATAGDQDTVRELLKDGANPNQPGQSILPLTGATSWGDAEMVKLLLDAGAEVPDRVPQKSALLDDHLDPARLHPAVAAIRAGSLSSLKLILGNKPGLDLTKLDPDIRREDREDNWKLSKDMIEEAIFMVHDDLAAFLVEKGFEIHDSRLLAKCIELGDDMKNTREAMLRRGIPAIQTSPYVSYPGKSTTDKTVEPWDALSAAVFIGNVDLTNRFLPLAGDMQDTYVEYLHSLANWCGNPEIIRAVRKRFPYPAVRAVTSFGRTTNHVDEDSGDAAARLFLPRTGVKAPQEIPSQHLWSLAVIPSPDAAGAAALVEAKASQQGRWKVVDRTLIEEALKEDNHAKPWEKGEHRLAELGDQLTADVILVVTKLAGMDVRLIRFEAVDVASGLVIHREYLEEKEFEKDAVADPVLARIDAALLRCHAGIRPLAVSMLAFTAADELPMSKALAGQFRSAIEIELDATPGILSVGMNEVRSITQEQAMKGEGAFWAAACTIEGGISALRDGKVALTLRLRNLGGDKEKLFDVTVEGVADDVPALASRAWGRLLETEAIPSTSKPPSKPDAKQAALEAARLTREAEWLIHCGKSREALPLADRAAALGGDPETTTMLIMAALVKQIPFGGNIPLRQFGTRSSGLPHSSHPPLLAYMHGLLENLAPSYELLDRTEEHYALYGAQCHRWKRRADDFWYSICLLSYVRSVVPPHMLEANEAQKFASFGSRLDRLTEEFFDGINKAGPISTSLDTSLILNTTEWLVLKRNPGLCNGLARTFRSDFKSRSGLLRSLIQRAANRVTDYKTTSWMAQQVSKDMDSMPADPRAALSRQLRLVACRGDASALLVRDLRREVLAGNRISFDAEGGRFTSYLTDDNRFSLRAYFRMMEDGFPTRRNMVLIPLFQEPRPTPECLARGGYLPEDRWEHRRDLLFMETSEDPKRWRNSLPDRLTSWPIKQLRESIKNEEKARGMKRKVDAFAGFDLMYGLNVSTTMEREWQKIFGNMPAGRSIKLGILSDLRKGPDASPGIFDLWLPDSTVPGRIWLRLRPYENGLTPTEGMYRNEHDVQRRAMWLLAVDGLTGDVRTLASLSSFPELRHEGSPDIRMKDSDPTLLHQNSTCLLTTVEWMNPENPKETSGAYALFDKNTGNVRSLLKGYQISTLNRHYAHQSTCVEVMNDDFFLLGSRQLGAFDPKLELVRMDSMGKLTHITQMGRRPELTPFDSVDRSPKLLVAKNGQLFLHDGEAHLAKYDPKGNTWTVETGDAKAFTHVMSSTMQEIYQQSVKKARTVTMPDGRSQLGIRGDEDPYNRHHSSCLLQIILPGGKAVDIPLEIDFPQDYRRSAKFIDRGYKVNKTEFPERILEVDGLLKQKRLTPVVLLQTQEHLVVALRIQADGIWNSNKAEIFLPFLWSLPKSELFRHLGVPAVK